MEVKTFGVIGAGQMGNGIAQVAAMSGLDVIMNDIKDEFVDRGLVTIGLTGAGGGELGPLVDHWLAVPSDHTPRIQEGHLVVEHLLCEIVERLGASHDQGIDVLVLLRDQGIVPEFPPAVEEAAEQTEFDVVMTGFGDKKLNVVKVVKNLTGASLMDAKKMVESAPATIKEKVSKEEAEKVKAELEEAGASVELK